MPKKAIGQRRSISSTCTDEKQSRRPPTKQQQHQQPPFLLFPETATDDEKTFSNGVNAVVNLLKGRKNVLVLVGAGMSVSVGIPDFRSKGSGLYETLDVHVSWLAFCQA